VKPLIRPMTHEEDAPSTGNDVSAGGVVDTQYETGGDAPEHGFEDPEHKGLPLRSGSEIWYEVQARRAQAPATLESQESEPAPVELPMPAEPVVPDDIEGDDAAASDLGSDADGRRFEVPHFAAPDVPSDSHASAIEEIAPAPTAMRKQQFRLTQVPGVPRSDSDSPDYSEPPRSPDQLKRVTDIVPFYDYEPDPSIRDEDPCRNICPRPDGAPCKTYEEGDTAPACPEEVSLGQGDYRERELAPSTFAWAASNLYHHPLYFEDPALERYGHTHGCLLQPFASTGRFSAQLLGLPYQMAIDPICKKRYTLGWYRPGECTPKLHYQVPWNTHAAAVQAGVMTGLFYAFP
jgi:hypothetical protein